MSARIATRRPFQRAQLTATPSVPLLETTPPRPKTATRPICRVHPVATTKPNNALLSRLGPELTQKLAEMCCARVTSLQGSLSDLHRKRDNYLLQMEDQFDYRRTLGEQDVERPTSIFAKQNDSINIIGGLSEFMAARTTDDLLGSLPFFSVNPEGKSDKMLAETMQKHADWRIRRSNISDAYSEAIATAYAIGECPVKEIYDQKTLFSESPMNLLTDKAGKFVVTPEGEYIFDTDKIITEIVQAPEAAPVSVQEDQQEGEPNDATTGETDAGTEQENEPQISRTYAEKSPTLDLAPFLPAQYAQAYIPQELPVGEAVQAATIHHRDFLCPATAPTLDDADFIAHLADFPLSVAKRKWNIDKDTLDMITQEDSKPKSEGQKPSHESDESEETIPYDPELTDPIVQFAECYTTTLVNGKQARLVCIVCIKARKIVFADYLANVTPTGSLPFFIVRPYPKKNRWYGRGFFEIYSYAQEFIERHLNYVAYRNRHCANPIRIVKRDMIKNIADGDDIPVGPDITIEMEKGADPKEAISFVEYPDLDQRTWQLMQMMMQVVQLRSGVTSAAQGGVDSLPQNSTATGIEAILNSGNVLSRKPIRDIKQSLEKALFYALKLIYTNLDEKEAFTYLEGDDAQLLTLNKEQIADLDFNVRMTMTRFRDRESRENAQKSIETYVQYLQIPEQEKQNARPLFVDVLKSYGQQEAEQIIRHPLPPPDPSTLPPPAL